MFKGELETIERYIHDLEAVKNYSTVKSERDSLAEQEAQLKQKTEQLETRLQNEISAKQKSSSQLGKREAELKELADRLAEKEAELSSLREFKLKLPDGGLSLNEVREQFLRVEEGEIERRAKARSEALEKDLHSRMPTLVYQRLLDLIRQPEPPPDIDKVIQDRANAMADGILRDKEIWPDWFKNYYHQQVKESVRKGLDAEFEKRVQVEAENEIESIKAAEWQQYVAEKARGLVADLKGALGQLQGSWGFDCDQCGQSLTLEVGISQLGELLCGKSIDVLCPTCRDPAPFPFILSTVPHKVGSLILADVLRDYVGDVPSNQ